VLARGRGSLPAQTGQGIASGDHKHTPPTCVIADDDPAVRSVLALAIARCALEPPGFGTAREVLDACRRNAPDLLFLDVALQGSDAIDVIRALGSNASAAPCNWSAGITRCSSPSSVSANDTGCGCWRRSTSRFGPAGSSRSWKSVLRAKLTGPSRRSRRRLPPIRRRDLRTSVRY
jgi:hypothetical protein